MILEKIMNLDQLVWNKNDGLDMRLQASLIPVSLVQDTVWYPEVHPFTRAMMLFKTEEFLGTLTNFGAQILFFQKIAHFIPFIIEIVLQHIDIGNILFWWLLSSVNMVIGIN